MKLESSPKDKTITARGAIGDFQDGISADDFLTVLKDHQGSDLTIYLNSEGGVVSEGLSIYNALMQHDGQVTIHVDTIAASIASVMLCAADKVTMNSNAKVMWHRCWSVAAGNCKDFRSTAEVMEMLDKDIAASYVEKTGMDESEVIAMMDAETWFDAETALSLGIVDEVYKVERQPAAKAVKEAFAMAPFVASKASATARRMKLRLKK